MSIDGAEGTRMTAIDPTALSEGESYRLATGVVVPRPIAWITTIGEGGTVNLAPFSCFTIVAYTPLMVGVSISRRPTGRKDTAANMAREREFVLNVVHESQADTVHRSSEVLPVDVSEAERLGLGTLPSRRVRAPRLAQAPVALECRVDQVLPFGDGDSEFWVGRVDLVHVREGMQRDGRIDTEALRPLARLAGPNYAAIGQVQRFSVAFQRP